MLLSDSEGDLKGFFMRDNSQLRDLILFLLDTPSTLRKFVMASPLSESTAAAMGKAMREEATPLEPMLSEFSFILNPSI